MSSYDLTKILKLKFGHWDQHHQGTIESWVTETDAAQLRNYVKGPTVQDMVKEQKLELQAHLVIIVGSRHILLWDMDKEGHLAPEPRLVEMAKRVDMQAV